MAVNRKTLLVLAALACALLVFSMLGCGTTNDLQSIQLSNSNASVVPPGTLDLQGEGATTQLYVWGNYSDGKQKVLNSVGDVAFQMTVTPGSVDQFSNPLLPPCQTPQCPNPASPPYTEGTIAYDANGLLTAVPPFVCTWVNSAQPPATAPAWGLAGSYTVTATYSGFTTPPVYVAVASQAGITNITNPTGECGPAPSS
jgi:hypothetical protein